MYYSRVSTPHNRQTGTDIKSSVHIYEQTTSVELITVPTLHFRYMAWRSM